MSNPNVADCRRLSHAAATTSGLPARRIIRHGCSAHRGRPRVLHITRSVSEVVAPPPVAPPAAPEAAAAPPPAALVLPEVVLHGPGGACWRVRQFQEDRDLKAMADLQCVSFHEPAAFAPLDSLARASFAAEVLDGARKKARSLRPDIFAILVASPAAAGDAHGAHGSGPSIQLAAAAAGGQGAGQGQGGMVGVVEVALQEEAEVAAQLPAPGLASPPPPAYAYLSSMAVAPGLRRQGVASALLAAAEAQAVLWGAQWLALHVYASNSAAVELYQARGLRVMGKDPAWKGWLGGRVRLLMARPLGEAVAVPRQ